MLSLYEILKASKTGIAPDMWTALAGMNWGGADSGHEVKELTGIPPLSFTADGTPLLDYLISGNTVQNGTPSPNNPVDVNGVGVRTENLVPPDLTRNYMALQGVIDGITRCAASTSGALYVIPASNSETYTIKVYTGDETLTILRCGFIDIATPTAGRLVTQAKEIINAKNPSLTTTNSANKPYFIFQVTGLYANEHGLADVMINTGSTAKPYEPYGYKIPISNGQQTTNIYLGSTQTTRQIEKITFDGSDDEDWYLERVNSYGIANFRLLNAIRPLKLGSLTWLSNRFVPQTSLIAQTETEGILLNPELICYIRIDSTTASTVTAFKQWLTENPVDLYYVLATPETAAVNEPLMKIGNYADTVSMEQAGVQIPTNRGNTVIDVLTELKPSQMYIKYQK